MFCTKDDILLKLFLLGGAVALVADEDVVGVGLVMTEPCAKLLHM